MRLAPPVLLDLRDGYVDVARHVLEHGRPREARGFKARDVADACFTVVDTRRVMPYGVGREIRPAVGYAEALLLCAGVESPSLAQSVSPAFRRFMDGGALAGSYGPLTRAQMPLVVDSLRSDRDSRQAVVQVHPGLQNVQGLRDVPCTINLGFELRGDGLHMRATMRSNDVWLGLAYDAFQFCQLGHTLANVLDVELKTYTHHAYSLHLYERDFDKVDALHACREDAWEPYGFGASWSCTRWEDARSRAEAVYERERPQPWLDDSESAYEDVLGAYDRQTRTEGFKS